MANTVAVKLLENGPRNILLHVYLRSDGVTGDLDAVNLITLAELGLQPLQRLRLGRLEYNFSGFDAVIEFASGGVTPNFKWVLTEGANAPVDFMSWGTIVDDSGLDGTGALQISTTGFDNSNDQGSILIKLIGP